MTQYYVMQAIWEIYGKNPFTTSQERLPMFNKVCGTDFVVKTFGRTLNVDDIKDFWFKDVDAFRKMSEKYRIY